MHGTHLTHTQLYKPTVREEEDNPSVFVLYNTYTVYDPDRYR